MKTENPRSELGKCDFNNRDTKTKTGGTVQEEVSRVVLMFWVYSYLLY